MFSKLALIAAASMALFVVAAPAAPINESTIQNSCNSGPNQCCDQSFSSTSKEASFLHQFFQVAGPITGQVGASCTPITGVGLSGTSCSSQPVCCSNNSFSGVVAFGCSPVNINA